MSKRSGWDQRLVIGSGGNGLVGHAGAVLLRKCADRTGLTSGLNAVLIRGSGPRWWDRGTVLVSLAVAVVLGAKSMSDIGLLTHQGLIFGEPPSEATVRRALSGLDEAVLKRIGKARAKVRARVWDLTMGQGPIIDRAAGGRNPRRAPVVVDSLESTMLKGSRDDE